MNMEIDIDQVYMQMALAEAEQASAIVEVPVGAVIVHESRVIGSAHNLRETLRDPTAHAEMIAITQAASYQIISKRRAEGYSSLIIGKEFQP